jgi:hypothetical protein
VQGIYIICDEVPRFIGAAVGLGLMVRSHVANTTSTKAAAGIYIVRCGFCWRLHGFEWEYFGDH